MDGRPCWHESLRGIAAAALAIAAWVVFAPVQIGGSAAFVIVNGVSMEPNLHRGDLVIVRRSDNYHVNDVVTYQDPIVGRVIHRIVGLASGRYTLRGDNNTWQDRFHPADTDIVGKLWLRIPGVGTWAAYLHQPQHLALLVTLAGGIGLISLFRDTQGKTSRRRKRPRGWHLSMSKTELSLNDLLYPLLTVAALSVGLGIFAFCQPLTRAMEKSLPYAHQGVFSYTAPDPNGIFDDSTVASGAPIFLSTTDTMSVTFVYAFSSSYVRQVAGTLRLVARVNDTSGWGRTIELAPTTAFSGTFFTITQSIDLRALQNLTKNLERVTGVHHGQYSVSVEPQVILAGIAADTPWQTTFVPHLNFRLDETGLYLADVDGHADLQDVLIQKLAGEIKQPAAEPNTFNLLVVSIDVSAARAASVAGLVVSALSLLAVFAGFRRNSPSTDIRSRYGRLLVATRQIQQPHNVLIDVASIEDLVKIAEKDNRMVLHMRDGLGDHYLVQDGTIGYRFSPGITSSASEAKNTAGVRSPVTS